MKTRNHKICEVLNNEVQLRADVLLLTAKKKLHICTTLCELNDYTFFCFLGAK